MPTGRSCRTRSPCDAFSELFGGKRRHSRVEQEKLKKEEDPVKFQEDEARKLANR